MLRQHRVRVSVMVNVRVSVRVSVKVSVRVNLVYEARSILSLTGSCVGSREKGERVSRCY